MISSHSLIKNCIYLFAILFSELIFCQNKELNKIDDFYKRSDKAFENYDNLKAFNYALLGKNLAFKKGDSKYLAEGYYRLSSILSDLALTKESLYYANKASEEKYTQKDKVLQAKILDIKSYNYYITGLSQTLKEELKAIKIIENENSVEANELRGRLYSSIAGYYENTKEDFDSAFIFYKLAENNFRKVPEKINLENLSYYYIRRGTFSIKKNDINPELTKDQKKSNYDSAFYYYNKSFELATKYKSATLQPQYQSFGDYYYSIDDYPKSLEFYLKSIKEKNSINEPYNIRTYKNISELYELLGDKQNHIKYSKIFDQKRAQLETGNSKNIDYIVKTILKDKQKEFDDNQRKKNIWIFGGIAGLLIFMFFIYKILHKKLQHKQTIISEVTYTLQEKENLISQKHIETTELKQKVNDAYGEVIDLAKNNDPSFYFRFLEVYPDFQKKLLEFSPGLRTSELVLCAYTFLGFNIKDVADYTFKSVNTVRNRKQNLRKKFNLSTEQDMGIWLRNLTGEK
ncbi:helix-turn-helix transcriptional regulator [Chryseobacterium sp. MMS23-Vi53]|uniref:helix-turn-helix transcriptional regulator n=1 Tax=Chryseobacterium sp. MMS23-Vi53 TaxID=3386644 RepID=UPI0039E93C0B